MLYQLSLYALSQPFGATATILYPTLSPAAREARLAIREAVAGGDRAYVVLRPVDLWYLHEVLTAFAGEKKQRQGEAFAQYFVVGDVLPEGVIAPWPQKLTGAVTPPTPA